MQGSTSATLSVVMPCLNGMPHIRNAIDSVKSVLPAGQYEIIVADGGSGDGTLDYLRNAGVVLIEGPDTSLYDGLNKAIARVRGQYVIWLNSDDLLGGGIPDLWSMALAQSSDIATGEAEITVDGETIWRSNHHAHAMSVASVLFAVPTINSRLISVGLLQRAGPFRTDIGLAADRYMLLRLLRMAGKRTFLNSTAYRYNAHDGSRTIGGTWKSYQRVHEASLQLIRALREDMSEAEGKSLLEAFDLFSAMACARAEFFRGSPRIALKQSLSAFRDYPSPTNWYRTLFLYSHHRGHGSGW